mgnify:CR=1 FL=1
MTNAFSSATLPSLVPSRTFHDLRGMFRKPLSFPSAETSVEVREVFWSKSKKGTVRGMHMQETGFAGWKLVSVIQGSIADYCVNLESAKDTFGEVYFNNLTQEGDSLLVPSGFAHGFQAREENTIVMYVTEFAYNPDHDTGFNPLSHPRVFWPEEIAHISERDSMLPDFASWISRE